MLSKKKTEKKSSKRTAEIVVDGKTINVQVKDESGKVIDVKALFHLDK